MLFHPVIKCYVIIDKILTFVEVIFIKQSAVKAESVTELAINAQSDLDAVGVFVFPEDIKILS